MGRRRIHDQDLPQRLVHRHGQYFYLHRHEGKQQWHSFGRDKAWAATHAEKLNELKRRERNDVFGVLRSVGEQLREQVLVRDGYRCVYCGAERDLGIDHVIPHIAGGSTMSFNLVAACTSCNATKGCGDPRQFLLELNRFAQRLVEALLVDLMDKPRILDSTAAAGEA